MTDKQQLILAVMLCIAYIGWVSCLLVRNWRAKRSQQHVEAGTFVVAYASQTGTAKQIAEQRAAAIESAQKVKLIALNDLTLDILRHTTEALFVVSTYGSGEPPDNGRRFASLLTSQQQGGRNNILQKLRYRVIALGDSIYPDFCAFGEMLYDRLAYLGATALDPLERIDRTGSQTLINAASDYSASHHSPSLWRVAERKQLNKGSGRELVLVTLKATRFLPEWRAGDILDVQPHNPKPVIDAWLDKHRLSAGMFVSIDGTPRAVECVLQARQLNDLPALGSADKEIADLPLLPLRSYSIASVPSEGQVQLIVRKQYSKQGVQGLGSGWLTTFAATDDVFCAYIKDNPVCHIPKDAAHILLIGAGSGLAGLRSQIAARVDARNNTDIWLIYGEQSPLSDNVLPSILAPWQENGRLSLRINKVFSRTEQGRYVQDMMAEAADELRNFIERGAYVYVCGSHKGMGQAVHHTLLQILGDDGMADLINKQRYHRDTY